MAELRKLLAEGYKVEAIESDDECVETVLARGPVRVSLTFEGREAFGLLTVPSPALAERRRMRWGR